MWTSSACLRERGCAKGTGPGDRVADLWRDSTQDWESRGSTAADQSRRELRVRRASLRSRWGVREREKMLGRAVRLRVTRGKGDMELTNDNVREPNGGDRNRSDRTGCLKEPFHEETPAAVARRPDRRLRLSC